MPIKLVGFVLSDGERLTVDFSDLVFSEPTVFLKGGGYDDVSKAIANGELQRPGGNKHFTLTPKEVKWLRDAIQPIADILFAGGFGEFRLVCENAKTALEKE